MHLLECVFNLEHCICTYVESNPFRVIPLLSDSSSHRETAHHRGRFRRKSSCDFGFVMYYMY